MKKLLALIIACCIVLTIYDNAVAISSTNSKTQNSISQNDIISLIGLDKAIVLKKIGTDSKLVKMGITNKDSGYFYKKYGVSLYFNKLNKLQYIQKNGESVLFDKKIENSFSSVEDSFGYKYIEKYQIKNDGQLHEVYSEEGNVYSLTYNYKEYVIDFISKFESGKDLKILIYKPNNSLDEKTLTKLLTTSQKDIISYFGNEYIMSVENDENFPNWIYFKALGLYFCNYDNKDPKKAYIEFDKNVSLGNSKSGMNYKQISSKLGKARIIETIDYTPNYRLSYVKYPRKNYNLQFISEHNDLTNSNMQMVQIDHDYEARMHDNLYWEFVDDGTKAILIYNNKKYPIDIISGNQIVPVYDEREYKSNNIPNEALGACKFSLYSEGEVDCFYVTVKENKIVVYKRTDNFEGETNQKPFVEALSIDINDYSNIDTQTQRGQNTIILETPPINYYLSKKVTPKEVKPLKIEQQSKKSNNIIDDEKWFKDNKLTYNTYEVPNSLRNIKGNVPNFVGATFNDLLITKAFYDESYIYCTYGNDYSEGYILNVYSKKTKKQLYSFDFSNYRYSRDFVDKDYDYVEQAVDWATIKNNTLYVSNSHYTYAESSCNMNAYITAISLDNYEILWRSKPLVSNVQNFIIINDVIVCGYGFTDEQDYLYQLNLYTGKTIKQIPIKSAASYIVKKGNYLFVRTYNTDYVYKI